MASHRFTRPFSAVLTIGFLAASVTACGSGTESSKTTTGRQRNSALVTETMTKGQPIVVSTNLYSSSLIDNAGHLYEFGSGANGYNAVPKLRGAGTKFVDVSEGYVNTVALDNAGQIYDWGFDDFEKIPAPELKNGGTRFTAITAGYYHRNALDDKGNLYGWGTDADNRINIPTLKKGATKWVGVDAFGAHTLAVDDMGNLYTWGELAFGLDQLPTLTKGGTKFVKVSTGAWNSLALDDKGNMYGWGYNYYGQATPPALKSGATAFTTIESATYTSMALDNQGNIYAWGLNDRSQATAPTLRGAGTKFVSLAPGATHYLVVDDAGTVYTTGSNMEGQIGIPNIEQMIVPVMPIAVGGSQAYGIGDDGHLERFDQTTGGYAPPEEGSYTSVVAGTRHALAITKDGTVVAWGDGMAGQTSVPKGLTNVIQVAAGYAYSEALRSDGSVVEWGSHTAAKGNMKDMPSDLPKLTSIAGGFSHVLGIVRRTGAVVGWGDNAYGKATPPALTQVISVAAGANCSAALKASGDIVYWGACLTAQEETTHVDGAKAIYFTDLTTIVLKKDGTLVTWGADWSDLLTVPTGQKIVAVSGGMRAVLAVTSTGDVLTWGDNMGNPITIPKSFGGLDPVVNDQPCESCDQGEGAGPQELTEEMIAKYAGDLRNYLTLNQLKIFVKALGGVYSDALTADEIEALIKAATSKQITTALNVANEPQQTITDLRAAALPASQNPTAKVGTTVTAKQAATILGLKKATKVSFIVPKSALSTCKVTKAAVTTTAAGSCNVAVKYTVKKKTKKALLSLLIG